MSYFEQLLANNDVRAASCGRSVITLIRNRTVGRIPISDRSTHDASLAEMRLVRSCREPHHELPRKRSMDSDDAASDASAALRQQEVRRLWLPSD